MKVADSDGAILSEKQLRAAITEIIGDRRGCQPSGEGEVSPSVLTALDRDSWGKAREAILTGPSAAALECLDAAILVCSLDTSTPTDADDLYETFLHGGKRGEPRWHDKSISLIVTPTGAAACNFEHSPMDGSTIIRMMNDVWHDALGTASGKMIPKAAAVSAVLVPSPVYHAFDR